MQQSYTSSALNNNEVRQTYLKHPLAKPGHGAPSAAHRAVLEPDVPGNLCQCAACVAISLDSPGNANDRYGIDTAYCGRCSLGLRRVSAAVHALRRGFDRGARDAHGCNWRQRTRRMRYCNSLNASIAFLLHTLRRQHAPERAKPRLGRTALRAIQHGAALPVSVSNFKCGNTAISPTNVTTSRKHSKETKKPSKSLTYWVLRSLTEPVRQQINVRR